MGKFSGDRKHLNKECDQKKVFRGGVTTEHSKLPQRKKKKRSAEVTL